MNKFISILLASSFGVTACNTNIEDINTSNAPPIEETEIKSVTPKMTAFYLECMKAGGIPGQEWRNTLTRKYYGPEYTFHIWTPDINEDYVQRALVVEYKNIYVPASPAPPKNIKVELQPGDTAIFSTNIFSLAKEPRGLPSKEPGNSIEYCMKSYPTVDLSGLNAPIESIIGNAVRPK